MKVEGVKAKLMLSGAGNRNTVGMKIVGILIGLLLVAPASAGRGRRAAPSLIPPWCGTGLPVITRSIFLPIFRRIRPWF